MAALSSHCVVHADCLIAKTWFRWWTNIKKKKMISNTHEPSQANWHENKKVKSRLFSPSHKKCSQYSQCIGCSMCKNSKFKVFLRNFLQRIRTARNSHYSIPIAVYSSDDSSTLAFNKNPLQFTKSISRNQERETHFCKCALRGEKKKKKKLLTFGASEAKKELIRDSFHLSTRATR